MPVIIEWIVAGISRIFATRLGSWIAQAMIFLGLNWATNEVSMTAVTAAIQSTMGQVGGTALSWLVFFNVPRYISIIVSAYGTGAAKRAFLVRKL
jgi:hypothetical protein